MGKTCWDFSMNLRSVCALKSEKKSNSLANEEKMFVGLRQTHKYT